MLTACPDNQTVVFTSCRADGSWSPVSLHCVYSPGSVAAPGLAGWTDQLQASLLTLTIIGKHASQCWTVFIVLQAAADSSSFSPSLLVWRWCAGNYCTILSDYSTVLYRRGGAKPTGGLLYSEQPPGLEPDYYSLDRGKVGVIVYDDLRTPHLVETEPSSILGIRSPRPTRSVL